MVIIVGDELNETEHLETTEAESEPVDAVTFPIFVLALGVISYRLLSRYAEWLPYTGFMFLLGTFIGVGVTRITGSHNLLGDSIREFWLPVDSELLLVSFLPGLLFHDAKGQNSHLFRAALNQCLIFAFPMVLAGTTLTALLAYYAFPYDWSFQLAMTFGSILSATDPVAVAALLEHVGAPPRLKVHIAGEALLNDGSAIVFFSIFSGSYLLELGVDGLGEEVDLASGIKLFFHKSLGGACVGALFGLGLLSILYLLNRRLDREENVTQVGATITIAYLCYFVSEVAWGASGVMAVVTLGVITTAFGETYINDPKLMADFWSIVEWLLNTVLFTLGGLVWGSIIGNKGDEEFPEREFTGRDWGYLIALYLFLTAIRFGLFACVFPITSRIGLKTNWKELIFMSYSGLRGAVGISLAIFLDNIVKSNAKGAELSEFANQTNKLFGFVGGIAFLTLMINGVFAGPLLKYLGLVDKTSTRKRMMNCYLDHNRQNGIREFIDLMSQRRFRKVNFTVIRAHVPFLRDVTRAEVIEAANKVFAEMDAQESVGSDSGVHLNGVLSFLNKIDDVETDERTLRRQASSTHSQFDMESIASDNVVLENNPADGNGAFFGASNIPAAMRRGNEELTANEFRRLFLELVRACYRKQIDSGELVDRGFVVLALIESLELAAESVERENRLNDWDYVFLVRHPSINALKYFKKQPKKEGEGDEKPTCCFSCYQFGESDKEPFCGLCSTIQDPEILRRRFDTEKCLAFILAHSTAQSIISEYFFSTTAEGHHLTEVIENKILAESEAQVAMAEAHLQQFNKDDVELAVSHKVCKILLNNSVKYFESLVENGLLKDQEVMEFYEEIQSSLQHIDSCSLKDHTGEYNRTKNRRSKHVVQNDNKDDNDDPSDEEKPPKEIHAEIDEVGEPIERKKKDKTKSEAELESFFAKDTTYDETNLTNWSIRESEEVEGQTDEAVVDKSKDEFVTDAPPNENKQEGASANDFPLKSETKVVDDESLIRTRKKAISVIQQTGAKSGVVIESIFDGCDMEEDTNQGGIVESSCEG